MSLKECWVECNGVLNLRNVSKSKSTFKEIEIGHQNLNSNIISGNEIQFIIRIFYCIIKINISMTDKVVFGYWPIRGLGQIPRLLLAYTETKWDEVKYASSQQWFGKDKTNLGLLFPNLPYLIDGDFKLTESKAINLYIIKRAGNNELLGKNIQDEATVQCIIGTLQDIRTPIIPLLWDQEWQAKVPTVFEKISPKLEELAKFYGQKNFALGYLTLADFQIAEFSYYIERISPQTFGKYEFLKRVRFAFEDLPQIKKYYEQQSAVKGPFLPPVSVLSF